MSNSRIRAASLAALFLTAPSVFGCRGCSCAPERTQLVSPKIDVPVSMSTVKTLASQGAEVSVQRRQENVGGACHSGACAPLLPLILLASMAAEEWDEVQLARPDGGHATLRFDLEGNLIDGVLETKEGKQFIQRLDLPAIDHSVIVETGRQLGTGPTRPSSLQAQLDLVSLYQRRLRPDLEPFRKGETLGELLSVLGDEGWPLAQEELGRVLDAPEGDEVASEAFREGCEKSGPPVCDKRLMLLAKGAPGPRTARAVLSLRDPKDLQATDCRPFLPGYLRSVCLDLGLEDWPKWGSQAAGAITPELIAQCASAPSKVLLQLEAGAEPSATQIAAACESTSHRPLVVNALRLHRTADRVGFFMVHGTQAEDLQDHEERLAAMEQLPFIPSAQEMGLLATAYAANAKRGLFERLGGLGTGDRIRVQALLLSLLGRGEAESVVARAILKAAVAEQSRSTSELALALFVVGERSFGGEAAKALSGQPELSDSQPPSSLEELVVYGLRRAGCTDEQILAAAEQAGGSQQPLGSICN